MFCSRFCSPTLLVFYLLLGTGTTGEDCFSINSCGQDPINLPLDTLISYRVSSSNWMNHVSMICPRSDSLNWMISYIDSMNTVLSGSYCSNMIEFDPSVVCVMDNVLTFLNLTTVYNTTGSFNITFTSQTFIAVVLIEYAPTGVTSDPNTVLLSSIINDGIPLEWFVYDEDLSVEVLVNYKGVQLANRTYTTDGYTFNRLNGICAVSTVNERTGVYNLFISEPSLTSDGEYTLIAGSFSDVVTVVLDSLAIIPTSSITASPTVTGIATSDIVSSSVSTVVSSNTLPNESLSSTVVSIISTSSSSIIISPSSTGSESSDLTTILASISVSAFALLVVLAIVITAIIGFLYCKRKHTNSDSGGCPRGDGDPRGDVPLESFSNQQESQVEETDFNSNDATNNSNNVTINREANSKSISGSATNTEPVRESFKPINKRCESVKMEAEQSHSTPITPTMSPKTPSDDLTSHSATAILDKHEEILQEEKEQTKILKVLLDLHKQDSEKREEQERIGRDTLDTVRDVMGIIESGQVTLSSIAEDRDSIQSSSECTNDNNSLTMNMDAT